MKKESKITRRGFTLIELLIVVGILAIASIAVVAVLNPAQLFAQARDSERVADLAALKSAITLHLGLIKNASLGDCLSGGVVTADPSPEMLTDGIFSSDPGLISDDQSVDGLGWVDIEFTSIPTGSPFSVLPIDSKNDDTYFYGYACDNTNNYFELIANMESIKYASGGSSDIESVDGGDRPRLYETGNNLTL